MLRNFDPVYSIAIVVALVVGIAIHEFSHAASAYLLGDTTAKDQGRLTLNPMAHFDPLGFMLLIFIALGFFGITWGRPVPVNPYKLKGGRRGMALTALAGPASNIVIASVLAMLWRTGVFDYHIISLGSSSMDLATVVQFVIAMNILLAVFNLIPIPPLDGFNILMGLVSDHWVPILAPLQQYGIVILLVLLFMAPMLGFNIIGQIVSPPQQLITNLLLGGRY